MNRTLAWLNTRTQPSRRWHVVAAVASNAFTGVLNGLADQRRDNKILALELRIAAIERDRAQRSGR